MKMKISIDKAPPTQAEIEDEKKRLETELTLLNRYKNKINNSRNKFLLFVFIVFLIWRPIDNFLTPFLCGIPIETFINIREQSHSIYWFERIMWAAASGGFLATLIEFLILFSNDKRPWLKSFHKIPFFLVGSLENNQRINETVSNIAGLNFIDKSHAAEIITWCKIYPELENYRSKVISLHRILIQAEFKAMQEWIIKNPDKVALGRLRNSNSI
jgi:hypothetical protein